MTLGADSINYCPFVLLENSSHRPFKLVMLLIYNSVDVGIMLRLATLIGNLSHCLKHLKVCAQIESVHNSNILINVPNELHHKSLALLYL